LIPQEFVIKNHTAIATEMPTDILNDKKRMYIEDIGEPITAAFLKSSSTDPKNW
jgi:hypothetical protein